MTHAGSTQDSAKDPQPTIRYCVDGGYIADLDTPLPVDPCDHDFPRLRVRGCNRLRCLDCRSMVRYALELDIAGKWLAPQDLTVLYDLPDPSSSSLLKPRKGHRIYFCRCAYCVPSLVSHSLGEPDPDSYSAPRVNWRCAGHPLATLPRRIDGVEITAENLGDVTVQALRGNLSASLPQADRWPGVWVARLYQRLSQTPYQQTVLAALLASVTDPSQEARVAALNSLSILDLPETSQRAFALLQGDRALFAGVLDPTLHGTPATLEHKLWLLARPLCAQPGPARELAKHDVLSPGRWNATLYDVLLQTEPDWVADHIPDLVRANPDAVVALVNAIQRVVSKRQDAATQAHLRQAVLSWVQTQVCQPSGGNKDLYALLASLSPAWLIAQLDDIVRANPTDLNHLVDVLGSPLSGVDPAAHKNAGARLIQRACEQLLRPGQGRARLYTQIAQADPQWFVAHLDELVRANPNDLVAIVQAIRPRVPDAAVLLAQRWQQARGLWNIELYRLLVRDHPQWFVAQAEALARHNPDSIPALVRAINDFPSRIPNWQALRDALKAQASSQSAR